MLRKEQRREEGSERGRERDRRRRRRRKERNVGVAFQPVSGTMPAKLATTPTAHGVSITHRGMAAIFQS